jgi:ubiquinol-cytochrome c reductase iron-sulfur subunit
MSDSPDEPTSGRTIGGRLGAGGESSTELERAATAPPATQVGSSGDGAGLVPAAPDVEDIDERRARTAERVLALLFTLSSACTVAFIVVYITYNLQRHEHTYTKILGLLLGGALGFLGIASILWTKTLMPDEEAVQDRHTLYDERENAVAGEVFMEGVADSQFLKRPLLRRTMLGSVTLLGLPAVVLLRSLAPDQPGKAFEHTNWQPGDRLFDAEKVQPVQLLDATKGIVLAIGGFTTVVPERAFTYEETKDAAGNVLERKAVLNQQIAADSATMLIRIRPGEFRGSRTNQSETIEGHVAYSKICTHLGCPVSLYEQQTHKLLCPCHQSQFLVTEGARPVFGPAARQLPQLPIYVDSEGFFRATRDFSEPVGPGYWERT